MRGGYTSGLQRGGILIMTLVFVSMFLVIFVALTGLVSRTYQESVHQAQEATAFGIAEAGLNYGRWRLAHDIDNYEAATKDMEDPFGGTLGSFDTIFQSPAPGATIVVI
ncbi:hypothetical protein IH781_03850, partial [Patescibacteria group bacterium]|nr:hypothetical protein [Patescibacteria group bacterium]